MIYLLSVILGIVEGLTEFLPVSSTAHLLLTQQVLKHRYPSLFVDREYWDMYTVVIQLGAILCLPIYFWDRIIKFLKTFPQGERGDKTIWTHPLTLVMVAFVVTALPTLALKKVVKNNLETPAVWGTAMLIGGVVMWVVDVVCTRRFNEGAKKKGSRNAFEAGGVTSAVARGTPVTGVAAALNPAATVLDEEDAKAAKAAGFHRTEHVEEMNLLQAIWIGACQILSGVFPGTSRSMSTIASGQISGMSRESALEFSFLLSIPTMTAATLWEGLKTVGLRKSGEGDLRQTDRHDERKVDRAPDRIYRLVLCCLGGRRLVHELGPQARVHPVCRLPDHSGDDCPGAGAQWRSESGRGAYSARTPPFGRCGAARLAGKVRRKC